MNPTNDSIREEFYQTFKLAEHKANGTLGSLMAQNLENAADFFLSKKEGWEIGATTVLIHNLKLYGVSGIDEALARMNQQTNHEEK